MRTRTRVKRSGTGRRKSRVNRNKSRRKRRIYGGAVGGGGDPMIVDRTPQERAEALRIAHQAARNRANANHNAAQARARGVTPMEGVTPAPATFVPSGVKHKHPNNPNKNNSKKQRTGPGFFDNNFDDNGI